MPKYEVTVKPGHRADDACACSTAPKRYTVEADSKREAITAAGKRWYDAECPDELPKECIHKREEVIAECSYSVKEV